MWGNTSVSPFRDADGQVAQWRSGAVTLAASTNMNIPHHSLKPDRLSTYMSCLLPSTGPK